MGEIIINSGIFPTVMSFSLEEKDDSITKIDLPSGTNLLYLQGINNNDEKKLLIKYANNQKFTDEDYQRLCELFFIEEPRDTEMNLQKNDLLGHFGVNMIRTEEGKHKFEVKEEFISQIKASTWECIALDILSPIYKEIINKFDFDVDSIYLGSWRSESNGIRQSILNSFRSAFIFTIFNYLYSEDRQAYTGFEEFFRSEFAKRIGLLYSIWKTQDKEQELSYLPIYDSFYNLVDVDKNKLINTLHMILNNDDIVLDERKELKSRIVNQAEKLHKIKSKDSIELEKGFVKPVVNYLMEIEAATSNLKAAIVLNQQELPNESINRSYYSMMHSLKAFLEHVGELSEWQDNILNVEENHKQLELKLRKLCEKGVLERELNEKYRYVKSKRWIADYNVSIFTIQDADECIVRAREFVERIKIITLNSK